MSFYLDASVLAAVSRAEHEWFAPLDFSGLSDPVGPGPPHEPHVLIPDRLLRRVYLDALADLHRLVEEYRFHALLAFTLLQDFDAKKKAGDLDDLPEDGPRPPWMLAEVLVVLQQYSREPPSPDELFEKPHQSISGHRILSRWFAAQLLDSALFRGIAACDRFVILLHCRSGKEIGTVRRTGELLAPSFTRGALQELDDVYGSRDAWTTLRNLVDDDEGLARLAKDLRNGFTHRRRWPAELHGELPVMYDALTKHESVEPVLRADDHWALVPAFYNHVMRPALEATRELVEPRPDEPRYRTDADP